MVVITVTNIISFCPRIFLPFKQCLLQIPFVPFLPYLSILINMSLMMMMNWGTWTRFGIWLLMGKFH